LAQQQQQLDTLLQRRLVRRELGLVRRELAVGGLPLL
jgi:hypothetical protein